MWKDLIATISFDGKESTLSILHEVYFFQFKEI